jgi:transposase
VVRSIGLDVHREFCEVAICEDGTTRRAGRIACDPQTLELFASSLSADDQVAMEATSNALAIARILEPHVARVVLAHPRKVRVIAEAKVKTDQIDARVLAELLACDYLPAIWVGDERSRVLRRQISQRRALVKRRTALKNEVSAALMRTLSPRSPASDPFGTKGRVWLAELALPEDERETVDACLRQLDFLAGELAHLEKLIARRVRGDEDVRRLMTIPGIDMITAATLVAVIGDIRRFPTSRQLVGYLGLHPTVKQSGNAPARHGRLAKDGSAAARHALTEAAWSAAKTPGPLHAFAQRISDRRGRQVATIALHASSPCWPGTCSPAARTTPSSDPASSAASCATWTCSPAPRAPSPAPTLTRSGTPPPTPPRNASRFRPRPPTGAWSTTGNPRGRRWVRARHRSAHHKGPRRARPRGRPKAPDACTSPRRSPAPNRSVTQGARTRQQVCISSVGDRR